MIAKKGKKKTFTDAGTGRGTIKRPINPNQIEMRKSKNKSTGKQEVAEAGARQGRDLANKKKSKSGASKQQVIAHKAKPKKKMQDGAEPSYKKKNWIAGAIKRPGALHREMGVAQGKKIPQGKLAAAANRGGKLGQRARLAETLEGMHAKKKDKVKAATKGAMYNGRAC